jgi:transcriptional regulator GlxA family with amidase domain
VNAGSPIPVAFLLDEGATVIDFSGPWEVFQDVVVGEDAGFELFTVSPSGDMLRASAGMRIVPSYTLADAPPARVIVIPAQGSRQPEDRATKVAWLRDRAADADIVLSVCTGAFLLAETGLLDGLSATTHHDFFDMFEERFPQIALVRGRRFVENGTILTSGGLTSGIDAALRVVERCYGRDVAMRTAEYMEYESTGWIDPDRPGLPDRQPHQEEPPV